MALTAAKANAVNGRATASCGGANASFDFLLDPLSCRYDPTKDAAALCTGEAGNGVTGTNGDVAKCVTAKEAIAINKIWYGMTADGSVPDPAVDNGGTTTLDAAAKQLWWGLGRSLDFSVLAGPTAPFPIASTQVALSLQNPAYAQVGALTNATGNGADKWKELTYAGLANAYDQGLLLQPQFSNINTDNPDLSGLKASGAKVLSYHGWSDNFIYPQGSLNYFTRAAAANGGTAELQKFNRLFMIPGLGHTSGFNGTGSIGPDGMVTPAANVPLPQTAAGRDELFTALRNWVEKGTAPERIELSAATGPFTMPICSYPMKATYKGTGDVKATASYDCQ